jgi:CheY-like chemotaxis protein
MTTIMIVDDNPVNLKLMSEILSSKFEVIKCVHAAEVLGYLEVNAAPSIILMDVALPGMDGLALTKLLKADERWKHIGIIAVTAFAMDSDKIKAKDAGCDGFITKPIDTRNFVNQISSHL